MPGLTVAQAFNRSMELLHRPTPPNLFVAAASAIATIQAAGLGR
jgi:hypothetical protein